jgi:hypothetical protein
MCTCGELSALSVPPNPLYQTNAGVAWQTLDEAVRECGRTLPTSGSPDRMQGKVLCPSWRFLIVTQPRQKELSPHFLNSELLTPEIAYKG